MRQDRLPPNTRGLDPHFRWSLWARVWEDGKAKWELIAVTSKATCEKIQVSYCDTHDDAETLILKPDEVPVMRFGNHCHRDWRPENAE